MKFGEMKKFQDALLEFRRAVLTEYGIEDAIVKIVLHPDLYKQIEHDLFLIHRDSGLLEIPDDYRLLGIKLAAQE